MNKVLVIEWHKTYYAKDKNNGGVYPDMNDFVIADSQSISRTPYISDFENIERHLENAEQHEMFGMLTGGQKQFVISALKSGNPAQLYVDTIDVLGDEGRYSTWLSPMCGSNQFEFFRTYYLFVPLDNLREYAK